MPDFALNWMRHGGVMDENADLALVFMLGAVLLVAILVTMRWM